MIVKKNSGAPLYLNIEAFCMVHASTSESRGSVIFENVYGTSLPVIVVAPSEENAVDFFQEVIFNERSNPHELIELKEGYGISQSTP